ncbi:MAG: hypothetical protein QG657_2778 [Acidobacteriota bacterium]|nr:hypothetical protein [Acidobacteriota bacterium]
MSNGSSGELSLKESVAKLEAFLEKVKVREPDIDISEANQALKIQKKFCELFEEFKKYINPNIFENDEYLTKYDEKRSAIHLNLLDSLKRFIDLYNIVAKNGNFSAEDLNEAWKALEHQFKFTERMWHIGYEIESEGVCGQRPIARPSLPNKP